jgi:hypothetical protein
MNATTYIATIVSSKKLLHNKRTSIEESWIEATEEKLHYTRQGELGVNETKSRILQRQK